MKNLAEHLVGLFLHVEFYKKMNYRRLFRYSGVFRKNEIGILHNQINLCNVLHKILSFLN